MTNYSGYVDISIEAKKAFAIVQLALEGSQFKPVDSNLKDLELKYKTSAGFMKNSWGEKINIVISSETAKKSTIYIDSQNNTGSPKVHKSNVEEIIELIKGQVENKKSGKITDSGFFTGAAAGAVATTTTTWFMSREYEVEDGGEGDDSGFDIDY
jgi:hypothetical protein